MPSAVADRSGSPSQFRPAASRVVRQDPFSRRIRRELAKALLRQAAESRDRQLVEEFAQRLTAELRKNQTAAMEDTGRDDRDDRAVVSA